MRLRLVPLALVALLTGACSGGEESGHPTIATTGAPTATATSPTTPAVPSTAPPATTPPTTAPATEPPTTEPPTTEPLTTEPLATVPGGTATTTEPLDPQLQATIDVIDAAEAAWAAFNASLADPDDDDLRAALASHYTAELLPGILEVIDDYRADGRAARDNPARASSFEVDPVSPIVDVESGRAWVVGCHVNAFIEVRLGTAADGGDEVLNDDVTIQIEARELQLEEGVWKIARASLADDERLSQPCE